MEKLFRLNNYPKIESISSVLVLQGEAKIHFHDFEKNNYELHFPVVYDLRHCVEVAFIARKFESDDDITREAIFTVFRVENSDFVKRFINDSDGAYGDEDDFQHYIIFEYLDSRVELIVTEPPVLKKMPVD